MNTLRRTSGVLCAAAAALCAQPPQRGARPPAPAAAPAAAQPEHKTAPPEEKTSVTHHTVSIGGQPVEYTATAGTILLKKEDGTPTASIFYIAYTRDGIADLTKRPLTFAYNGGPGSSSVWLQLGALGPKRVPIDPEGNPSKPPYKLVDNEYSILNATDLVFIDPVSTGFSRAIPEQDAKNFHGVQEDVRSVGDFIRLYTTRHGRWASPKFLAGESYGTTRSAALSGYLQDNTGMYLNGIMLLSSVLNFETISFDRGNDLPYILFLPTYTAIAWFHKKLPADLMGSREKALAESEKFAAREYTLALMQGDRLAAAERAQTAQKLARLTGLPEKYIEDSDLRVPIFRFTKELLRGEHRTVGRYDGRVEGIDEDRTGSNPEYDPSYSLVQGPYTAAFNQYVREELKWETDLPYEILTGRVFPWNFGQSENRYLNVAETLRSAMTQNPALKVFVANGYYDLATPYFATQYTFGHMSLDPSLRSHVSMGYYDAGHMMYIRVQSLEKLAGDLRKFMAGAE